MIRLLGSRKFINMPVGTLYVEYWKKTIKECAELIDAFLSNPSSFLDTRDLLVYFDNGWSLVLGGQKNKDDLGLTDINVVGDADPSCTLRVILDPNDLPNVIQIRGTEYENIDNWTKQELLQIIENLKDEYESDSKEIYGWAIEELDRLHDGGSSIVDVDISVDLGGKLR